MCFCDVSSVRPKFLWHLAGMKSAGRVVERIAGSGPEAVMEAVERHVADYTAKQAEKKKR